MSPFRSDSGSSQPRLRLRYMAPFSSESRPDQRVVISTGSECCRLEIAMRNEPLQIGIRELPAALAFEVHGSFLLRVEAGSACRHLHRLRVLPVGDCNAQ